MIDDKNTIVVGRKSFWTYKAYALSLITTGQLANMKIVARGPKNIYKALSLAEVIKRENKGFEPKIVSKSEEQEVNGKKRMVTAVEISFVKNS